MSTQYIQSLWEMLLASDATVIGGCLTANGKLSLEYAKLSNKFDYYPSCIVSIVLD